MRKNKIILAGLAGFGLAVAFGLLVACQNQSATTTNDTSAQGAQGAPEVAGTPGADFPGGQPPMDGTPPAGGFRPRQGMTGTLPAGAIGPGGNISGTRRGFPGRGVTGTVPGGVAPGGVVTNTAGGVPGGVAPSGAVTNTAGTGNAAQGAAPTALATRVVTASTNVAADGALALSGPTVSVGFESSGKVTAVNVVPGQAVKKGDVLAELDPQALNEALLQAQQSLELKQAQIEKSLAPTQQSDIDTANANLNSAYAAYAEVKAGPKASDVKSALSSWNQAKNSLYQAQLGRDQECEFVPGTTTDAQMAAAKADKSNMDCYTSDLSVQASDMRERAAYQSYLDAQEPPTQDELTKAWASVVQAQTSLAALEQGVSDDQKAVYDLQLEQARLAVERAQRDLAQARLVSPCDCVVQAVELSVGASANGSITLLDTARLQFRTSNLNERDVVKLKAGQSVTIRLKAYDQTLTGKVGAILPVSSGTSSSVALYTVLIDLDPTTLSLLPGMTGQAQINLQ
jgi:multidrug resistance efflux pump